MFCTISCEKLFHHPKNRSDLGDLEELTESIRENGILQNLSVVKYNPVIHGEILDSNNQALPADAYIVIAGNRRLEAAMAAGVSDLPCQILELDSSQEIATMIQENLLRKDMTAKEQNDSFQLMLDFGSSVETIQKKTGFTMRSVRQRMNVASAADSEFDQHPAVSMSDLMEVHQFQDKEIRDKLMESVGTPQFEFELTRAKDNQKRKDIYDKLLEKICEFASEFPESENRSDYETVIVVTPDNDVSDIKIPADTATRKYYYDAQSGRYIDVCTKSNCQKSSKDTDAEKENRALVEREYEDHMNELTQINRCAYESRRKFIATLPADIAKSCFPDIVTIFGNHMEKMAMLYPYSTNSFPKPDASFMASCFDSGLLEDGNSIENWNEICSRCPESAFLSFVYQSMDDPKESYIECKKAKTNKCSLPCKVPLYTPNENLNSVYELMNILGYHMTGDEEQYVCGTHHLFFNRSTHE